MENLVNEFVDGNLHIFTKESKRYVEQIIPRVRRWTQQKLIGQTAARLHKGSVAFEIFQTGVGSYTPLLADQEIARAIEQLLGEEALHRNLLVFAYWKLIGNGYWSGPFLADSKSPVDGQNLKRRELLPRPTSTSGRPEAPNRDGETRDKPKTSKAELKVLRKEWNREARVKKEKERAKRALNIKKNGRPRGVKKRSLTAGLAAKEEAMRRVWGPNKTQRTVYTKGKNRDPLFRLLPGSFESGKKR